LSTTQQIPVPVEDPYALDDPADQSVTFYHDRMHFPFPVSPLFQSIHGPAFAQGITQVARETNAPVSAYEHRIRNNYQFERMVPKVPRNEEEAHQMGELAEQTMKPEFSRMLERWNQEHLPRILEIQSRLREIIGAAPAAAATPEHIDEVRSLLAELWTIHFRIVQPSILALQLFDEFYADLFGADADAHALVAGVPSATLRAGVALTELAKAAQELDLASTLLNFPVESIPGRLAESDAGREFLARLSAFHDQFGLRQDLIDLITPTWQENPTIALASVRSYLENGRDIGIEHQEQERRAAVATANARERLAPYPQSVRDQFDALLQFARDGAFVKEEHNFYIDQQGLALVRLVFLRVGQHLAETGRIDVPDDVFMVRVEELRDAAAGDPIDLRPIVRERRTSFEMSRQMTPPPFIGAPPEGPPPTDNPMARAMLRFFGGPPQESGDPNLIKGTAGSRGSATGAAFIARTLQEATNVKPGQILVTVTTTPPWTPLFGIAAAIVTETGGPLSHCAIVAREYGLPAVVGAHGATERIQQGQTITVDGTNGMVELLQ
jgi:pyruvate,water dikinase